MRDPVFVVEAVKFVAVVVANILVPVALRLPVLVVPKFPILAKRLVNIPVTLFIRFATILLAVVVPVKLRPFKEEMFEVAMTPFTVVVKVLEAPLRVKVLVVEEANRELTDVVEITPFTLETRLEPEVVSELADITEEVATTPFTVVVRVLPLSD